MPAPATRTAVDAPAAPRVVEAPGTVEAPASPNAAGPAAAFTGVVCSGVGEAAGFLAIDWVRDGMRRAFGFEPWPGTLNLRMDGSDWQRWRSGLFEHPAIVLEPAPGFCPARCFAVRLAECIDAAIVFPEVPGYAQDKLEIVASLHLRTALALRDGDRLLVRVKPAGNP